MSDHEALLFSINSGGNNHYAKLHHKIFLYHKGSIEGIKVNLVAFQNIFMTIMSCNPHSRSVEDNWNHFKSLLATIVKNIPQKVAISKRAHLG